MRYVDIRYKFRFKEIQFISGFLVPVFFYIRFSVSTLLVFIKQQKTFVSISAYQITNKTFFVWPATRVS